MSEQMHIDAAEYKADNTLWLIDPKGGRVGINPDDDDFNRNQAIDYWSNAWKEHQYKNAKPKE